MKLPTDNYIRIGTHPNIAFIFFSSKDSSALDSIRTQVQDLTEGSTRVPVVMWRRTTGLNYPLVGESRRGIG